jgi:3-hydroxybutyryl-CoA dehydrogenase
MDRTVGVAGAGTMGSGIAIVLARAGFETRMYDVSQETGDRALTQIEQFFANGVAKGRLTEAGRSAALARLTFSTDIGALANAQLVIEAVFEDLDTKGRLLASLNAVCGPDTIFASNTSTLSITELASASGRPERVVGMHFCLPAQLMKLVEMTPAVTTAAEVFDQAWTLCVAMGQRPVRTLDRPGFILNHLLVPFNNDAVRLVERGIAEPADIDRAVKVGLGYPMGPCELLDYVGLDTQVRLCDALYGITHDPRTACPPLLRRMVSAGRLGRKTGRGFYTYDRVAMFGA